jgi:hypothetical protein
VSLMAAYDAQLKSFHERWLSQARLNGGKGM